MLTVAVHARATVHNTGYAQWWMADGGAHALHADIPRRSTEQGATAVVAGWLGATCLATHRAGLNLARGAEWRVLGARRVYA